MDFDKLYKWLGLIANFGVVAGLGLLVLELNHASRLPEAGHVLVWEQPDVFNGILIDFLKRH